MLRSWGGPARPCNLGGVSWASNTLSAKGKRGHSPCALSASPWGCSQWDFCLPRTSCPHRSTVQPGWGLNTHLTLTGQCTKRPEGLTRTAPSYPCHYWGCEQLSHLSLGHPEVSLKRTHQAGALGPWQGLLLQARYVRERMGIPCAGGEEGMAVRAGCQGPGIP